MEKRYKHSENKGLPGGPNEVFTYTTGIFSTEGYRSNSPDVGNPFNIIPSRNITMKEDNGEPLRSYEKILGIDPNGNSQVMTSGNNYTFQEGPITEIPLAQNGGEDALYNKYKKIRAEGYPEDQAWAMAYSYRDRGQLPKAQDGTETKKPKKDYSRLIRRMNDLLPAQTYGSDEGFWSMKYEDIIKKNPEMEGVLAFSDDLRNSPGERQYTKDSKEGKAFLKYAKRIASPESWMTLYPATMGEFFDPKNDPEKFRSIKKRWGDYTPQQVEDSQFYSTSFDEVTPERLKQVTEANKEMEITGRRDDLHRIIRDQKEQNRLLKEQKQVDIDRGKTPAWKAAGYANPTDYYNYLHTGNDIIPSMDEIVGKDNILGLISEKMGDISIPTDDDFYNWGVETAIPAIIDKGLQLKSRILSNPIVKSIGSDVMHNIEADLNFGSDTPWFMDPYRGSSWALRGLGVGDTEHDDRFYQGDYPKTKEEAHAIARKKLGNNKTYYYDNVLYTTRNKGEIVNVKGADTHKIFENIEKGLKKKYGDKEGPKMFERYKETYLAAGAPQYFTKTTGLDKFAKELGITGKSPVGKLLPADEYGKIPITLPISAHGQVNLDPDVLDPENWEDAYYSSIAEQIHNKQIKKIGRRGFVDRFTGKDIESSDLIQQGIYRDDIPDYLWGLHSKFKEDSPYDRPGSLEHAHSKSDEATEDYILQGTPQSKKYWENIPVFSKKHEDHKHGGTIKFKEGGPKDDLREKLNPVRSASMPRANPFGFLVDPKYTEGNLVGGAGINFPRGFGVNALGVLPLSANPVFKGVGSLGISQKFGNWDIGAKLSTPVLRDWETKKLTTNFEPSLTGKYTIPYTDKRNTSGLRLQDGAETTVMYQTLNLDKKLDEEINKVMQKDITLMKKQKIINRLVDIYNKSVSPEYKKGGSVLSERVQLYSDYINNVDKSTKAKNAYDKLNRVYYREAKKLKVSPADYIMTHVIGS